MSSIAHYVTLEASAAHADLLAHAAYLACAGTQETDDFVHVFFEGEAYDQEAKAWTALLEQMDISYCLYCMIPRNWNQAWEDSFQPVQIGDICRIRASFHDQVDQDDVHEIIVDPKMAFGTGHHETTSMMIAQMSKIDLADKTVLDYGCGTGVLAIFAEMRGARSIDAIDYDIHSYDSTSENAQLNRCKSIQAYHGDLEVAPADTYELILANINRGVLEKRIPDLCNMLEPNGQLLISGILLTDYSLIREVARKTDLRLDSVELTGDWLCMVWTRIDA